MFKGLQKKYTDYVLLAAFAKGDRGAAQQLTEQLMPKIHAHAYYRLGNIADAEDVTQEAFLKLWKIAPNWKQDKAQVSTWLYRVVSNLCKDRYRRATLEGMLSVEEPTNESQSPSSKIEEELRQKALYAAMSILPESQRLAVQLRHIDELTNPQIAEIMELSVEAVESLTARGKRKLTKILQSHKSELGYSHG
ncbi:sigma-70 family RNA polymerase sigma factor [Paracoccaceae bacterium]|nr:sigma-70 family RNA polymerase sigma factor [Paracoccaceae bacterium]